MDEREIREREAVYGGWRDCRTLEDVAAQEELLDGFEARIGGDLGDDPRGVLASDVAIARELLKLQRRAIERFGPEGGPDGAERSKGQ